MNWIIMVLVYFGSGFCATCLLAGAEILASMLTRGSVKTLESLEQLRSNLTAPNTLINVVRVCWWFMLWPIKVRHEGVTGDLYKVIFGYTSM